MPQQQSDGSKVTKVDSPHERLRMIISWVIVVILLSFGVFSLIKLATVHETAGDYWQSLIRVQFPVIVGLPMAGLGALFLTLILRISTGPLEFEIGGLKFKGGAAPIVFWIIIFLSISVSIGLLWQK